ncbi:cytochrome P450 89A2 [Populus alba]|uniref:Cytochrome P450 89A2-like n=2 Tax=Populus TaxID=3689 RepID=A0A4U5QFZ2_POPAL|nr:cytochrome P450 89A2-like [Populus alba]KAJ6975181.1 cytochrome P450 89A2-like [Populus alba x Populus x berolinensis]TKS09508.1 cytochrome P450 89A2-like [Populus alba]
MEIWLLVLISLSLCVFLKALFNHVFLSQTHSLPPAPFTFPVIGNILWIRKSTSELERAIRSLNQKLGPMVTLHMGSRPAIFIADRSLAYIALIQKGAVFANRPPASATSRGLGNQHNINSSFYGPTWRLLRRNLTSEILHPSRVKTFGHARKWVLNILMNQFKLSKSGDPVRVVDHFQYAMFCLLVLMCFGDKLEEKQIQEIEQVQRRMVVNISRFNILNFWPSLSKIVLRKRWAEFLRLHKDREDVILPLIRARKKLKEQRLRKLNMEENKDEHVLSYVDTLLDLQLPDEKRKLNDLEIVSLCNEFLNGGTDTTTTALQWIMANLVKYPQIQEKLLLEIKDVVGEGEEAVKEDDLQKMPYLKAIILEGLRRHPPARMVLPHAVTEDTVVGGFLVPKNGTVNFMVADIGWDSKAWEDPMAFKPERFLNSEREAFDITGSREIKMMPFGAGRRICPGYGLAMLHLEYFVANLVLNFEWKAVDGDDIDLSEKQELTIVMKNPLRAHLSPRVAT